MRNFVRLLKSLSDETRLRILNMLFERECCVCEIMQVLCMSQPRISHHLGALYNAGLLKMRRQGLFALYSIDWEGMDQHTADIIRSVRAGLEQNHTAREDVQKLANTERLLPECARTA